MATTFAKRFASRFEFGARPTLVGRVSAGSPRDLTLIYSDASGDFERGVAALWRDSVLPAAIFVASPDLHDVLSKSGVTERPLPAKLRKSLAKYAVRMCTRTAPFGLFAAIGTVRISPFGCIALRRYADTCAVRPSGDWLYAAQQDAASSASDELLVVRNDRVVVRAQRYFVMDEADVRDGSITRGPLSKHVSKSVRRTALVEVVRQAGAEPITLSDLIQRCSETFPAIARNAVADAVHGLLRAGILEVALQPLPTADGALDFVDAIRQSASCYAPAAEAFLSKFGNVERALLTGDFAPLRALASDLRLQGADATRASRPSLKVDLGCRFDGGLPPSVLADVALLGEIMMRCSKHATMEGWHQAFQARYDTPVRDVPLLELLSPDFGITPVGDVQKFSRAEGRTSLYSLAMEAHAAGCIELEVSETRLDEILPAASDFPEPESFEIAFHVFARGDGLDTGDYLIHPGDMMLSPAAGASIGRFSNVLPDLEFVPPSASHGTQGSEDGCIHAELVYLPGEPHAYNVMTRPVVTDHVIDIGLRTPNKQRIELDDILVRRVNGRFVLYSRSLQQRICVHQTHMLNIHATASSPLARFLAGCALDGRSYPAGFAWPADEHLPFMPRLRCGRVVFSLARWNLPVEVLGSRDWEQELGEWRSRWHVPSLVRHTRGDDKFVLDLSSSLGRELLRDCARGMSTGAIALEEAFGLESDYLRGADAPRVVEYVIGAYSKRDEELPRLTAPVGATHRRQRPLGFGWVFAKVFVGKGYADALLHEYVSQLVARLRSLQVLKNWFFIRYADKDGRFHIRLRMEPASRSETDTVLRELLAFCTELFEAEIIEDFEFPTYEPELERYGLEPGLVQAESLFTYDSDAFIEERHAGSMKPDDRIISCVDSFFKLMDRAGLTVAAAVWFRSRQVERRKLSTSLRAAVRKLVDARAGAIAADGRPAHDEGSEQRAFGEFFHMHCNRWGIEPRYEPVCLMVARQVIVGAESRAELQYA
jgi:lantibiotic biosynthesis protein